MSTPVRPADSPVVLDPFSAEFCTDPYPIYQRLRSEQPVYHSDTWGFWALSRFADIDRAYHDVASFSNAYGCTLDDVLRGELAPAHSILTMDPPEHTRMRRLVTKVFTPRALAAFEPVMAQIIGVHLAVLEERDEFDVATEFCALFPSEIIARMLGFPADECDLIRLWTDRMLIREPGNPNITQTGLDALVEYRDYTCRLVRRKRANPVDDLLSDLCRVSVERDDGERYALTDNEIVDFAMQLASAGSETTVKLVSTALVLLHRHPDQWQTLVADSSGIPNAVEEVLRFESPVQFNARFTLRSVEMGGRIIPAGAPVMLLIGSGNRDAEAFPEPDSFEIRRPRRPNLGFGVGAHHCVGAALARIEAGIALAAIARIWPNFWIDEARCEHAQMTNLLGYSAVPMRTRAK